VVQEAMTHLPPEEMTTPQLDRLNARLAVKRGEVETERRELERLLLADPADLTTAERLAQLADKDGKPARAAELRRQKGEIDQVRARYQRLYDRNQPIRDAVEMAQLAERLGRRFEARGYLTLAISDDPSRQDLRKVLERLSLAPSIVSNRGLTGPGVVARRENQRR
jgi:enediyne biosynthesis protein E4